MLPCPGSEEPRLGLTWFQTSLGPCLLQGMAGIPGLYPELSMLGSWASLHYAIQIFWYPPPLLSALSVSLLLFSFSSFSLSSRRTHFSLSLPSSLLPVWLPRAISNKPTFMYYNFILELAHSILIGTQGFTHATQTHY